MYKRRAAKHMQFYNEYHMPVKSAYEKDIM